MKRLVSRIGEAQVNTHQVKCEVSAKEKTPTQAQLMSTKAAKSQVSPSYPQFYSSGDEDKNHTLAQPIF